MGVLPMAISFLIHLALCVPVLSRKCPRSRHDADNIFPVRSIIPEVNIMPQWFWWLLGTLILLGVLWLVGVRLKLTTGNSNSYVPPQTRSWVTTCLATRRTEVIRNR